ncbi:hypothetical protein RHMOL_Rhmol02G0105000 [Rhododendron molle]|uniref:Uncharacterized protein n=1 Tax=Rhododendron molle TaxID=49168 RepID=A0ACC0PQ80_RHOML|nr:hypothetical protein RHMOL_Rhmol02G0105000 [Rhododendron molle]
MIGMVHDAFGVPRHDGGIRDNAGLENMGLRPDKETKKFFKLLENAQRELYPNSQPYSGQQLDDGSYTLDNDVNWVRTDVDGVIVDDDYDNVGPEDGEEEEVDDSDEEEIDYSEEEEDCTDDDDDNDDDDFEENDEDGDHNKDD